MWNEKFQLSDGPYFVPDFQDYFQYIIRKHEVTDNLLIRICGYELENRIILKIKNGDN